MSSEMRFRKDKTFKIMQITDIQEIPSVSKDTLALMEAALDQEKPDLVIYTGDQISGNSAKFKGAEGKATLAATIQKIFEPVISREIPFAVTFGNHDCQCGISNREQYDDIYSKLPGIIGDQPLELDARGNCRIPVLASDGSEDEKFSIYLFDSGTDAATGGYEAIDPAILQWYETKRNEHWKKHGSYTPSMVFQHIPLREYYEVLKQVPKNTKGAVRAYRTHKNEYYVLGDSCGSDDRFLEPASVPDVNTGEFESLSQYGDVLAVFVGHDHKNNFVGRYQNIDLGFTPSAGFNVYGDRLHRGVRCIVLHEDEPKAYETYVRTYEELVGTHVTRPIFDYLTSVAPATLEDAIAMLVKLLGIIFVVVLIVILLCYLI